MPRYWTRWLVSFLILCSCIVEAVAPDLTVEIPMRDGVALSTDLYFPSTEANQHPKSYPCILLRSPSGRHGAWDNFYDLAQLGYVIAVQETRSVSDKEGKTLPFLSDGWGEQQDGYDTIEWLAKSPYTNGKVGTWGASAMGITQHLLAPSHPPHLVCQYILVAAPSLYHHAIFPGGRLLKNQTEWWLRYYAHDPGILHDISQRSHYDRFWEQMDATKWASQVNVPAIHIAGWYDTFLTGSIEGFITRQRQGGPQARGRQKLVIGPWTHFWPLTQQLGDFQVPASGAHIPFDISPRRWFAHYLQGVENGVEQLPAVIYYVMGPFDGSPSTGNVWKTAAQWPIPSTPISYYLTPKKTLSSALPGSSSLAYSYDPNHPIPTLGGHNLFLPSGPVDQRPIETREDLSVFSSAPLTEEVEITGTPSITLWLSSNSQETDVIVHLTDRYPDGRSILIAEGMQKVTWTPSEDRQKRVQISLNPTSLVFAKGHAIGVSVSSSSFPRYEKSHPFSSHSSRVENRLFFGRETPSCLQLPVIPRSDP